MGQGTLHLFSDVTGTVKEHSTSRNTVFTILTVPRPSNSPSVIRNKYTTELNKD